MLRRNARAGYEGGGREADGRRGIGPSGGRGEAARVGAPPWEDSSAGPAREGGPAAEPGRRRGVFRLLRWRGMGAAAGGGALAGIGLGE